MPQAENRKIGIFIQDLLRRFNRCFWTEKFGDILCLLPGTPELGGQEGQLPPLPFAGRGKGGKSAL